jgi:sugar-phosphatase
LGNTIISGTTAAIFDMDGLLIDSEPLWQDSEIAVFGELGVPLTRTMCHETTGLRLDAVVRHWYEKHPWQGTSFEAVEARVLDKVRQAIVERGRPMPGVQDAIDNLLVTNHRLAVASSSPMSLIRTVLHQLEIIDHFSVLRSSESEVEGKPHPAVYTSTTALLGVKPEHCLAFEDSVPGVRSAKSAGTRVIAVPAPSDFSNPGFDEADAKLRSLAEFVL